MSDVALPVPDLLPARMLNEYVYCPRLFYLEWVDRQWESSDDTEAGRWVHRDVDGRGGVLDDQDPPATVRSVALSDETWGLAAVIDRVDHADGTCSPVDYKRGRPDADGNPWPADRIQSLAQCALLESAGFDVRQGVLFYAEPHRRVSIPWTLEGREELTSAVAEARRVASKPRPPMPLVDSPKCTRCSLAGLCLPDEINALLGRREAVGRRILPRDPDSRPVYVTEPGSMVSVKGGRLHVTHRGESVMDMRLIDVQSSSVFGNVQVSTQALGRLWGVGAPVLYLSSGGWLNGWSQGQPMKNVELRRRQVLAGVDGLQYATRMVNGKIRNQRTLLRRLARGGVPQEVLVSLSGLAERTLTTESLGELLGIEGAAARLYFKEFPRLFADHVEVGGDFSSYGRRRRPALDPVNSALNYCYALLVRDLVVACLSVGLDPYVGVFHRSRFGRPSLALDLMEEFRPIVADSVVVSAFNNGELAAGDFQRRGVGVQLTAAGRKTLARAYERRVESEMTHPVYRYRISYRRVFEVQVRVLGAAMLGEVDHYVPVVTR